MGFPPESHGSQRQKSKSNGYIRFENIPRPERSDILRFAITLCGDNQMNKRGKKAKRTNLLELSAVERIQLIRKAKEKLRENVVEAKLWRSFVEAENVTVNGHSIHCGDIDPKGFALSELSYGT